TISELAEPFGISLTGMKKAAAPGPADLLGGDEPELRVVEDRVHQITRRVEHALDSDLEIARRRDRGLSLLVGGHLSPFVVRSSSSPNRSRRSSSIRRCSSIHSCTSSRRRGPT